MELAAALTVWACFSSFLIFPLLGVPQRLAHAAMALLCAELLLCLVWTVGTERCSQRPCGTLPETARTAASIDVPGLTGAVIALAIAYGIRAARRGGR
jgi:hypothetical protein